MNYSETYTMYINNVNPNFTHFIAYMLICHMYLFLDGIMATFTKFPISAWQQCLSNRRTVGGYSDIFSLLCAQEEWQDDNI